MRDKSLDQTTKDNIDFLYETIMKIDQKSECEALFSDLCTLKELASISQRLVVAKMLMEKKIYSEIVQKTGASTATISRVNRSIVMGEGGYEQLFAKFNEGEVN